MGIRQPCTMSTTTRIILSAESSRSSRRSSFFERIGKRTLNDVVPADAYLRRDAESGRVEKSHGIGQHFDVAAYHHTVCPWVERSDIEIGAESAGFQRSRHSA